MEQIQENFHVASSETAEVDLAYKGYKGRYKTR